MTSIAVTASICASASEAALLVASFMPISLDLGTRLGHWTWARLIAARKAPATVSFLLGTPRDEDSLYESPLSEYRLCQGRTVMRRHFGSDAADLCACDGIFKAACRSTAGASC